MSGGRLSERSGGRGGCFIMRRGKPCMDIKTKCLVFLILMGIIDVVIPVPIMGIFLIYVLLQRPPWFFEMVKEVYGAG
jgi:hypothetical protein